MGGSYEPLAAPLEVPPSAADPKARRALGRAGHCGVLTPDKVWDVVVVGAGIAGSALAFKLGSVRRFQTSS